MVVHNAGQYVGVTSSNERAIEAKESGFNFGDGSMVSYGGSVDLTQYDYYQVRIFRSNDQERSDDY